MTRETRPRPAPSSGDPFGARRPLGSDGPDFYALSALAEVFPDLVGAPLTLRILLENALRHAGHGIVEAHHVELLAAWRPGARRHCIWELVLHTAYWKYAVRRRLTGGEIGSFPRSRSNWPRLPDQLTQAAWRSDVALLKAEHRKLRAAVAALAPRFFAVKGGRGRWTNAEVIHGIAMHDLYHAGQVQLIKRLQGARGR